MIWINNWLIKFFCLIGFYFFVTAIVIAVFSSQVVSRSLWPMDCSTPGSPVPHYLLEFAQIHVHWVGYVIQLFHPLLPSSPPALNLSQHLDVFQWVSSCVRWPKYWSFSFSISPSKEYSGLISFRIGCFDLLVVQGTLQSLLQHHSSEPSILWQPSLWYNSHIHTWLEKP